MALQPPSPARCVLFFKTVQASALKGLFEVLKDVLHDVVMTFDASGVKILTTDGKRCSLVHLKLDAKNFEEYHCRRPTHAGVNMFCMHRVMKSVSSHDTVVWYMLEEDPGRLFVEYQNVDKWSRIGVHLMDVDSQELQMPDIVFDSIITMPSAHFQRQCRDMAFHSDVLVLKSQGGTLTMECAGDKISQTTVMQESENGVTFAQGGDITGEPFEGRFYFSFLNLFTKATTLSNTLELFMSKEYPLILKYSVASLGELQFCLAAVLDD